MKALRTLAVLSLTFALAACSTNEVGMTYNTTGVAKKGSPVIAVSEVNDNRNNDDAHWLGAVRGGFGQPIKTLTTKEPVSDVVKEAITSGMKARGLYAAKPSYKLFASIKEFNCSQYVRREAHILLDVTVISASSQKQVFSKTVKVDKVSGSALALDTGLFADADDLRVVANDALQEAVDQLLNDPAFRAAI